MDYSNPLTVAVAAKKIYDTHGANLKEAFQAILTMEGPTKRQKEKIRDQYLRNVAYNAPETQQHFNPMGYDNQAYH